MAILLILALVLIGAGASSSSSSSSRDKTVINNHQYQQPQQPIIYQQPVPPQPAPQPAPVVQQKTKGKTNSSSIRNFAVKSYDKIAKDSQNGNGEHLNSLILLMESEGVPKDESLPLIKRALRKSNGNAEIFGDEIENSL